MFLSSENEAAKKAHDVSKTYELETTYTSKDGKEALEQMRPEREASAATQFAADSKGSGEALKASASRSVSKLVFSKHSKRHREVSSASCNAVRQEP